MDLGILDYDSYDVSEHDHHGQAAPAAGLNPVAHNDTMNHSNMAMAHAGHAQSAPMDHSAHSANSPNANGHTAVGHSMMSMSFHFGYDETILFDWWTIQSISGLLVSIGLIVLLGVVYEAVKWFRYWLAHRQQCVPGCRGGSACRCNRRRHSAVSPPSRGHQSVPPTHSQPPSNSNPPMPSCCRANTESAQPLTNADADNGTDQGGTSHEHTQQAEVLIVGNAQANEPFAPRLQYCMCHIVQTVLYGVQLILAYALMLIAMTYNVWLFSAVIGGSMLGNLLFALVGKGKASAQNMMLADHCH